MGRKVKCAIRYCIGPFGVGLGSQAGPHGVFLLDGVVELEQGSVALKGRYSLIEVRK